MSLFLKEFFNHKRLTLSNQAFNNCTFAQLCTLIQHRNIILQLTNPLLRTRRPELATWTAVPLSWPQQRAVGGKRREKASSVNNFNGQYSMFVHFHYDMKLTAFSYKLESNLDPSMCAYEWVFGKIVLTVNRSFYPMKLQDCIAKLLILIMYFDLFLSFYQSHVVLRMHEHLLKCLLNSLRKYDFVSRCVSDWNEWFQQLFPLAFSRATRTVGGP